MNKTVSCEGYDIINGIIKDFPPEVLLELQQRVIDVATGIAIGMKTEMELAKAN